MEARSNELREQAHKSTQTALGLSAKPEDWQKRDDYEDRLEEDPAWLAADKLWKEADRIGMWGRFVRGERRRVLRGEREYWSVITLKGRLIFHPPDVPVQVWAVTIDRRGVHWFDVEVTKVTTRNVVVRYHGEPARLDRQKLWYWWAWYRAVRFVSARSGRIATALDSEWQRKYGATGAPPPPSLQMPLEQARLILGVPVDYSRQDVIAAFRRKAKAMHPDAGGTAEQFRFLVEARDRLLAALGTSAPKPKMPDYAPRGVRVVYRAGRSSTNRQLGSSRRLLGH